MEALRRRGRAYVDFGLEHPEQYRILFMGKSQFSVEDFQADRLPGMERFAELVRNVQAGMDTGALTSGDAYLSATRLWVLLHGLTSLRIAVPGFPGIHSEELLDHMLDAVAPRPGS